MFSLGRNQQRPKILLRFTGMLSPSRSTTTFFGVISVIAHSMNCHMVSRLIATRSAAGFSGSSFNQVSVSGESDWGSPKTIQCTASRGTSKVLSPSDR